MKKEAFEKPLFSFGIGKVIDKRKKKIIVNSQYFDTQ